MRLRRLLVLLLAASGLAACAQQVPRYAAAPEGRYEARSDLDARMYGAPQRAAYAMAQAPKVVPVRAAKPVADRPYTLDAGDKLRVVVFGQDALSNNYTVGADGAVTLPLIGAVPARGLTTTQLSGAIGGKLRQGYIRDPSVAVEVESYRPFFVLGEVTYPGQYPYVPNMTVRPPSPSPAASPRARTRTAWWSSAVRRAPPPAMPCRCKARCARATPSPSPSAGSERKGCAHRHILKV
jgi:polysaccharide export outer membrane protein